VKDERRKVKGKKRSLPCGEGWGGVKLDTSSQTQDER